MKAVLGVKKNEKKLKSDKRLNSDKSHAFDTMENVFEVKDKGKLQT